MRLTKLTEGIGETVCEKTEKEQDISSLCIDSRLAKKGDLFFCLTGGNQDGHNFALDAVKKGAVALVVERVLPISVPQILVSNTRIALAKIAARFYGNPEERLKIIGITGTNGKTTTSYMLQAILEKANKKVGVIGTLGVSCLHTVVSSPLTTPDPIELYKTLAEMFLKGVEYVVMEVSAHALYYHKVYGIAFTACIFTNCTQDHLDFFKDMQSYQDTKTTLFHTDVCPIAVLNGDDETGRKIGELRKENGTETLYYGLQTPTDAFAVVTHESLDKTECLFNVNDKLCRVRLALVGKHNVYNALAAATCAVALKIELSPIAKGLCDLQGVCGRLQRVETYNGAEIFVDFAHTPDGLAQSIQTLKPHCKGRLVCLFGCGGNRDKSKRSVMGETAAKLCDFCIITSDNPRYEDPMDIIAEIERGYRRFSMRYVIVPERESAIRYAIEFLKAGDILLVAGKGGERYQEIMGIKYPFDDNDIIEKIIREKGNGSIPIR